jgi:hypothetical protein
LPVIRGPVTADIPAGGDGVHWTTNAQRDAVVPRFVAATLDHFATVYPAGFTAVGRGPRVSTVTLNAARTLIRIKFDKALAQSYTHYDGTSDTEFGGIRVTLDGSDVTITSALLAGVSEPDTVDVTPSAAIGAGTVLASFLSGQDGFGGSVSAVPRDSDGQPAEPFLDMEAVQEIGVVGRRSSHLRAGSRGVS